ncbi:MAG: hypothetical protein ACREJW_00105 [Candidatus Methylomirabilales bacterium]
MHKQLSKFALNALRLADHIEALDPKDFDMTHPARCVAGHCLTLFGQTEPQSFMECASLARNLGISREAAFFIYLSVSITQADAAAMLRRLAVTDAIS